MAARPGNSATRRCDILNLELGPIDLDLLGLVVTTSDICLDVYAQRGQGNLLGNLLCSVVELLDKPRSQLKAQRATLAQINRLLNRLGL